MSDVIVEVDLPKVVHLVDYLSVLGGPFEVVINRGARDGVQPGERFLVFGYGPELVDLDTGGNLGRLELVRGRAEVVHVQDQMATLRSLERRQTRPRRRVFRPAGGIVAAAQLVEEEVPPDETVGFEGVRVGDLAKPI